MNPSLGRANSGGRGRLGLTAAALFAAALAAYLPALGAGFVWDDNGHVTRPDLQSLHGLGRIWFELGATQQYYPVLHSAFWVEHRLWGEAPLGYHLLNVLLHATAGFLFVMILRTLAQGASPAEGPRRGTNEGWTLLAGFIFVLHPVCVESVAWISEQKNTLSAVFYLLACLAYLRYDGSLAGRSSGKKWYLASFLLFVLAVLSKSVTATLPGALLVILWWKRGALSWRRDAFPLLPFFAVGIGGGLFTAWVERNYIGAHGAAFDLSLVERCLLAGRALGFYLAKAVWPSRLIFNYERWHVSASEARQYICPLAALAVLIGLWSLRRRSRAPLAAGLFFAGTLFPALGFFNVYPFVYSYVADHFQYLAMLGVIALAAAGAGSVPGRFGRAAVLGGAAVAAALGVLTWRQCGIYRDSQTLYTRTIAANPSAWMAYNNLGNLEYRRGRMEEAIARYRQALRLNPDLPEAEDNLGLALIRTGHLAEALPHFRRAIAINPAEAEPYENLGVALNSSGRPAEAIADFEAALHLAASDNAGLRFNLGNAYAALGRFSEAIASYRQALQLRPDYAPARCYLGAALAQTGDVDQGIAELRQAIADDPAYAPARRILSEIEAAR